MCGIWCYSARISGCVRFGFGGFGGFGNIGVRFVATLMCVGWLGFEDLAFYSAIWFWYLLFDCCGRVCCVWYCYWFAAGFAVFACVASVLTVLCLFNCCLVFLVLLLLFVLGSDSWFTIYLVCLRVNSVAAFYILC